MSPLSFHKMLNLHMLLSLVLLFRTSTYGSGLASSSDAIVGNISKVEDAQNFHIYYGQTFKVIKNFIDGQSYLLIQAELFVHSSIVVSIPVSFLKLTRCMLMESRLLGLLPSMKGITSESVASECVLKMVDKGDIKLIDRNDSQQFNQFSTHFISDSDQEQACNFADFIPFGEDTPLQRAEWIKFLGVFENLETRSNNIYNSVKDNYMCLSKMAANTTRSLKPVVAWMEYYDVSGAWSFTKEVYKLKYVEDAGGENLDDSINKVSYNISNPDDVEALHAILCTVDVVVDGTQTPDPAAYNRTTFLQHIGVEDNSCFAFLSNQSLWRYDKRLHNSTILDWYDGAVSQPQLVLADLIEVLFPTGNYTTTYFRNIAKAEGVVNIDGSMCERDISTPLEPKLPVCK
ncbi:hypothetical protein K2173_019801 [Erythroxylum novogranatense]|uniref:Uncharacterized protein n=1 Tax=Erythroxylum novogranatense TaxID=1862640 RepID=A0AAV8SMD8_9ROSI|nr:hypothetical protein K2173_019801 [Erythroxylum novogranatense]